MLLLRRLALTSRWSHCQNLLKSNKFSQLTPPLLYSFSSNQQHSNYQNNSKHEGQSKSGGAGPGAGGPKSFMNVDSNIKRVSLRSIQSSLEKRAQTGSQAENEIRFPINQFKTSDETDLYEITEGGVRILLDGTYSGVQGQATFEKKIEDSMNMNHFQMFYNFVLLVERDLTLLIANQHLRDLEIAASKSTNNQQPFAGGKVFTGSAESGVKTLRMCSEIDPSYIQSITTIEKSKNFPAYFDLMTRYNGIDTSKVNSNEQLFGASQIVQNMALEKFMSQKIAKNYDAEAKELFDFIDIDSQGSSIENIRQALHLVKDGGIISAVFSDMSCLCGPNIVKCFSQYHIIRSKMSSLDENAVRIVYSSISDAAATHNLVIEPILTFRSDFYVKVFFKVRHNGSKAMRVLENKANVLQCSVCPNYHVHQIAQVKQESEQSVLVMNPFNAPHSCPECNSPWKLNGPIWSGQLHSNEFLDRIAIKLQSTQNDKVFSKSRTMHLQSIVKLRAYIDTILEESDSLKNTILGFSIKDINGFFKASRFPQFDAIKRALARAGYEIGRCGLQKDVYKSDAPMHVIFDVLKGWRLFTAKISNESEKKTSKSNEEGSNQSNPSSNASETTSSRGSSDKSSEISPALAFALKKPQQFYPKFRGFSPQEKENIQDSFADPTYLEQKTQRTVFFPNPTNNWGPKKQFNAVYSHKFDKQVLEQPETENNKSNSNRTNEQPPTSNH